MRIDCENLRTLFFGLIKSPAQSRGSARFRMPCKILRKLLRVDKDFFQMIFLAHEFGDCHVEVRGCHGQPQFGQHFLHFFICNNFLMSALHTKNCSNQRNWTTILICHQIVSFTLVQGRGPANLCQHLS
jgi:hypothetical protein